LNIHTEILDSHVARLTVQIDEDVFQNAKKRATKAIAKKVNIPGFRKGHAPYHLIANYYGEATIIEETVEMLANELYSSVIESSGLNPYTSGTIESFELEPQPHFIFSVPLQPETDLKDYRSIRVDYTEAVVTDEEIETAMLEIQREKSQATLSTEAAVMGDRVSGSLHGYWADELEDEDDDEEVIEEADEPADENQDGEIVSESDDLDVLEDEDGDDEDEDFNEHIDAIIHEHDAILYLSEEHEFAPGASAHLIGAEAGKRIEFILNYPKEDKYRSLSGRAVRFVMDVAKVEHVTFPELNDDLAREITQSESSPLGLAELRERILQNIRLQRQKELNESYIEAVIAEIAQQANFRYPELMVAEEVDELISSWASRVGMEAKDFLALMKQSDEDVTQNPIYRPQAIQRIEHLLVLRGVMQAENIVVTPLQVEEEIARAIASMNPDEESKYRKMFSTREMREKVYNRLLEESILDRIVQIGRGLAESQQVVLSEQPSDETSSASE